MKGGSLEVVIGESQPDRVMLVEFDHVGQARSWMGSAEFTQFRELVGACANVHAMIVEGL